jgi:hypothetical protein
METYIMVPDIRQSELQIYQFTCRSVYVTDFKYSQFIVDVEFALWSLHCVDVGSVTSSVLKMEAACACKIISNTALSHTVQIFSSRINLSIIIQLANETH